MRLGSNHVMFIRLKILLLVFFVVIISSSQSAYAFRSFPDLAKYAKLPGAVTSISYYYDQINSALSLTNSGEEITHAINQWGFASWYTIFSTGIGGSPSGSNKLIRAVWFGAEWFQTACGNTITMGDAKIIAMSCPQNVVVLLNSEGDWEWNTEGLQGLSGNRSWECFCDREYQDLLRATLHELGHIWGIAHPFNTAPDTVMNSAIWSQTLYEDDKRAATSYYGPNTSFETNVTLSWFPGHTYAEALGHDTLLSHKKDINGGLLQIAPAQLGVTPYTGSQMRKIYGVANTNYSYIYLKLFTADDDEVASNFRYLKIKNGMQLLWRQYNHAQNRMSVDLLFTDGTTLRDSPLTDQNGVCVHPACRGSYATGVWHFFKVNLSSLSGKTVKDIMIAYDNGNNGPTGVFRGYFDNLTISYTNN